MSKDKKMKKIYKYLIIIGILFILFIIGTWMYLNSASFVRNAILGSLSKKLGYEVKAEKINFSLTNSIEMENITYASEEKTFISAKKLVCKYDCWAILAGNIKINEFSLEGVKGDLEVLENGKIDAFSKVKKSESKEKIKLEDINLDVSNVKISDINIQVFDKKLNKKSFFTLKELSLKELHSNKDFILNASFNSQIESEQTKFSLQDSSIVLKGTLAKGASLDKASLQGLFNQFSFEDIKAKKSFNKNYVLDIEFQDSKGNLSFKENKKDIKGFNIKFDCKEELIKASIKADKFPLDFTQIFLPKAVDVLKAKLSLNQDIKYNIKNKNSLFLQGKLNVEDISVLPFKNLNVSFNNELNNQAIKLDGNLDNKGESLLSFASSATKNGLTYKGKGECKVHNNFFKSLLIFLNFDEINYKLNFDYVFKDKKLQFAFDKNLSAKNLKLPRVNLLPSLDVINKGNGDFSFKDHVCNFDTKTTIKLPTQEINTIIKSIKPLKILGKNEIEIAIDQVHIPKLIALLEKKEPKKSIFSTDVESPKKTSIKLHNKIDLNVLFKLDKLFVTDAIKVDKINLPIEVKDSTVSLTKGELFLGRDKMSFDAKASFDDKVKADFSLNPASVNLDFLQQELVGKVDIKELKVSLEDVLKAQLNLEGSNIKSNKISLNNYLGGIKNLLGIKQDFLSLEDVKLKAQLNDKTIKLNQASFNGVMSLNLDNSSFTVQENLVDVAIDKYEISLAVNSMIAPLLQSKKSFLDKNNIKLENNKLVFEDSLKATLNKDKLQEELLQKILAKAATKLSNISPGAGLLNDLNNLQENPAGGILDLLNKKDILKPKKKDENKDKDIKDEIKDKLKDKALEELKDLF